MNILLITGIFPPETGGPATHIPIIAQSLNEKGHKVRVLCTTEAGQNFDDKYSFRVIRVKSENKFLKRFKAIYEIIKHSKDTDILYANGLPFASTIASVILNKRILVKIVGDKAWEKLRREGWYNGSIDEYQKEEKAIYSKMLDLYRSAPARHANKVVVPSKYLKKIVTKWGVDESKVEVVYNASPIREGPPSCPLSRSVKKIDTDKSETVLLTVARLTSWKGVEQIVKSLNNLNNCSLIIAGDGPYRTHIEQAIIDEGLCGRVHMPGKIPREDVLYLMSKSDVLVHNSGYEGLPHVVLEAMSLGLPCVVAEVGGVSELISDMYNGVLFTKDNIKGIEMSIKKLLGNDNLRKKVINNAKETVNKDFSERQMIDRVEEIIMDTKHER